jgi:L-cysteate sulfo-lyase
MNLFRLSFQTPFQPMPRLKAFLKGPGLMVKRDDLTPFGGGKYRKVFALVEDAHNRGATILLTEGSIESRHARTTAILARQKGIPCVLVLSPETDPDSQERTLLDCNEGARIILTRHWSHRGEVLEQVSKDLAATGERPVVIPFSGSTPLTALAYAQAFIEIKEQADALGLSLDAIFFSSASGGIQAGLELGKRYTRADTTLLIGVTPGIPVVEIQKQTVELAEAAAGLLGIKLSLHADEICVMDNYVGEGYLKPTQESRAAITLAAELEGLTLDPTYTAKTFAALIDQIKSRRFLKHQTVVFLHTAG